MEKEDNYENQNEVLKQLHIERIKRAALKAPSETNESLLEKVIMKDTNQNENYAQKEQNNIKKNKNYNFYLNPLVYDHFQSKEKRKISLCNFLHPDFIAPRFTFYSSELESIMISTYGFELEVFQPLLNTSIPLIIINRMVDSPIGKVQTKYEGIKNLTVLSPPKSNSAYGVFHTKLWLIKFKKMLRIVVCTSNQHVMDWTVWQNVYWYHDCPLIQNQSTNKLETQSNTIPNQDFKDKIHNLGNKSKENYSIFNKKDNQPIKEFNYAKDFLDSLKLVINNMTPKNYNLLLQLNLVLEDYDYSKVQAILISSIPGRHKGQQMENIGLSKIKKIISTYGQLNTKDALLTCNSTSLGRLSLSFFKDIYQSFCPTSKFNIQKFQLVYPTKRYIQQQTCQHTEVLYLKTNNYENSDCKQILCQYEPKIPGSIPHLKTIIITPVDSKECILYVGSHNLTKAAWGTFEKNQTQINCLNQELGLLFLNYPKDILTQWLPYLLPVKKYTLNDKPFLRD